MKTKLDFTQHAPQPPRAHYGWFFAGLLFGLFGWGIALATDKGDGRAKKAFGGFLIWLPFIIAGGALFLTFSYRLYSEVRQYEDEDELRLTLGETMRLPTTECSLVYWRDTLYADDILIGLTADVDNFKISHRHDLTGKWVALQRDEMRLGKGSGQEGQLVVNYWRSAGRKTIEGSGIHLFEIRSREGADKFEIMATLPAHYTLDIKCPLVPLRDLQLALATEIARGSYASVQSDGVLHLSTPMSLTNAGCSVAYREVMPHDELVFGFRIWEGTAQVHWRKNHVGDWKQLRDPELFVPEGGDEDDQGIRFDKPNITGAGTHQFEVRTRQGIDKFDIREDWPAGYVIDMSC